LESEGGDVECGLNHTLALFVGKHLCISPLAEQQSQSTEEDGFASPGLACDDHKALGKGDVGLPNQSVILNVQCFEHVFLNVLIRECVISRVI